MGVMETDQWGEKHFEQPWKMVKLARPEIKDEHDFYHYLLRFGMYQPSSRSLHLFNQLKQEKVWDRVEIIYQKYKKKWGGPTVNIYLFPINQENQFFMRQLQGRAGLSFSDTIFLFISTGLSDEQIESLFVHEYHHAARMTKYKKQTNEYTLLDSVLFEGLAETAVLNSCGKKYTAFWTEIFSEDKLKGMLEKFYSPAFHIKRNDPKHDYLLFGGRKGIPNMMGYAIGYEMARGYIRNNKITMNETFSIPSDQLLENNTFLSS
ncbi:hypothetical protein ACA30_03475 [Virgibacillus soli]|uniref:DUF2268 domain-containing protein n=2 Tax=Lederbergia galactosidilytica TaxID=217031 RepID=A0A177ZJF7_9BACI|nr:hypothetical protein ACA30_03475 [Virgibacillus soli]OAK67733.1 hypothetical protein ABB05_18705 [Lederbergia galactosidilytica]